MGNSIADIRFPSFDGNNYDIIEMVGSMALSFPTLLFPTVTDLDHGENYPAQIYEVSITPDSSNRVSSWRLKMKSSHSVPSRPEFINRLMKLREKAISEGMRLLDADEVIAEVKQRRGEII